MSRRLRDSRAPYLFLLPLTAVLCVFFVWPLWRSLELSFYTTAGPRTGRFVGFGNYTFLILHDRLFWLAVANTIAYTLAFLIVQIPASLGLAMLLNHPAVRMKSLLRFCFFSTYLVGQVFVAVVFFALLAPRRGLVNRGLSEIIPAAANLDWLTRPSLVLPATLLAGLWLSIGYGMIYFLAALQSVDANLYEAAILDGAGRWAAFRHVTLPGIRPVLVFLIVVGTIGGFQLFELPYVLLQGPGPNYRALTIVMYLYASAFDRGDLGYSAAIGWLLVLLLGAVSAAQLKLSGALRDDA
jgi:lactose/L-arabinose transport system permease protein